MKDKNNHDKDEKGSAEDLAAKLEGVLDQSASERLALGASLREVAARDHEVDALMGRLVREMGGGT